VRVLPLYIAIRRSRCSNVLVRDVMRAATPGGGQPAKTEAEARRLMLRALEWRHVRSIVYYRMWQSGGRERLVARILKLALPGLSCLELNVGRLGAGFVIGHGYGSVIWAESIGEDCTIYQNVTIGQSHGRLPSLGDRVHVAPGAAILGAVMVGNDAVIGANAVVVRDVPQGATMVGVPARPLEREPTKV